MGRGPARLFCLLILIAGSVTTGCSTGKPHVQEGTGSSNLLFGDEPPTALATELGRSDWPAVYGRIEDGEFTVYIEHYRDHQGTWWGDNGNPRRYFDSYRVGTQSR